MSKNYIEKLRNECRKITKFTKTDDKNDMWRTVVEKKVQKILDVGKPVEFTEDELSFLIGYDVDPSQMFNEGFIIHDKGFNICKVMENGTSVAMIVMKILDCCQFKLKINISTFNIFSENHDI